MIYSNARERPVAGEETPPVLNWASGVELSRRLRDDLLGRHTLFFWAVRTGSSSIIKIGKSINFNLNSNKLRQLGFSRVQIFDCFSFFFRSWWN